MCVIATVEAQVRSSSVGVLCVVRLRLSKAALQKRGSMEPLCIRHCCQQTICSDVHSSHSR